MTSAADLLPELKDWNDGKGLSPTDWLFLNARSDMGVAFADLFWPTFVEFEGHVFRDDFSLSNFRAWQANGTDRKGIEAVVNLLDTHDLFVAPGEVSSDLIVQRAVHVGRVLAETYRMKLEREFPGKAFVVEFNDGSDLRDDDIYVTFYQA